MLALLVVLRLNLNAVKLLQVSALNNHKKHPRGKKRRFWINHGIVCVLSRALASRERCIVRPVEQKALHTRKCTREPPTATWKEIQLNEEEWSQAFESYKWNKLRKYKHWLHFTSHRYYVEMIYGMVKTLIGWNKYIQSVLGKYPVFCNHRIGLIPLRASLRCIGWYFAKTCPTRWEWDAKTSHVGTWFLS